LRRRAIENPRSSRQLQFHRDRLSRNARTRAAPAAKIEWVGLAHRRVQPSRATRIVRARDRIDTNREMQMKRLLAVAIAAAFCATAAAQQTAPAAEAPKTKAEANKAKQDMVKGTTEAAATQSGVAPYKGKASGAEKKDKMTKEERKQAMEGASKIGGSQYGTSAGQQAASVKKDAPKAAKPDMSDPKVREAMEKQKP
jgi:hypothetical protein